MIILATAVDEENTIITARSDYSGKEYSKMLPISLDQLNQWMNTSTLIQDVFPHLSNSDREFLMTGISDEEWDEMFSPNLGDE
jgi:hypothetical protein